MIGLSLTAARDAYAGSQPAPAPQGSPPAAVAQPVVTAQPGATPQLATSQPATSQPAPPTTTPPAAREPATPDPATTTIVPANTEPTTTASAATESATAESATPAWYEQLELMLFADGFVSVNYNQPLRGGEPNVGHGNDWSSGFGFAWAGLDFSYAAAPVGGTVALRFGPVSELYNGQDTDYGLQYLKQAYASFSPRRLDGRLTVDFGKFDTIYGAEVGDSFPNFNYTRGVQVWLQQPFFHTGLRANYQINDIAGLTVIAVNGWNNTLDNNRGKSFGVQSSFATRTGAFEATLGYLAGPEGNEQITVTCPDDQAFNEGDARCVDAPGTPGSTRELRVAGVNSRWRHLFDLVLRAHAGPRLTFLFNGTLVYDEIVNNPVTGSFDPAYIYGVMLAAQYQFTARWAVAARAEFLHDLNLAWTANLGAHSPSGPDHSIGTGTLTLRFEPTPNFVMMLDTRVDGANDTIFNRGDEMGVSTTQVTSTLGVIVKTR